jgi:hypothetical protein
VAAFGAPPSLARDYLRCATFKTWMVAADDPELAELPPPSPWPISRRSPWAFPDSACFHPSGPGANRARAEMLVISAAATPQRFE